MFAALFYDCGFDDELAFDFGRGFVVLLRMTLLLIHLIVHLISSQVYS